MKCSEIHEGLPQKEIRDFLGMAIVLAFEDERQNKKKIIQHTGGDEDIFEWAKADAREQIKYLEIYIKNISNKQAISNLIDKNGWQEHDVSNDVYNDTNYRLGMTFIGTEEEHQVLLKTLYPDDEPQT